MTQSFRVVKTKVDLEKDISKLSEWTTRWQMKFSADDCKVMQMGKNYPKYTYMVMGLNVISHHCGQFAKNNSSSVLSNRPKSK